MVAIEVLIYSHKGIGKQQMLPIPHRSDSMAILQGFRQKSALLYRSTKGERHGEHDMPDFFTLDLKWFKLSNFDDISGRINSGRNGRCRPVFSDRIQT
jgi:hypothetical protein